MASSWRSNSRLGWLEILPKVVGSTLGWQLPQNWPAAAPQAPPQPALAAPLATLQLGTKAVQCTLLGIGGQRKRGVPLKVSMTQLLFLRCTKAFSMYIWTAEALSGINSCVKRDRKS